MGECEGEGGEYNLVKGPPPFGPPFGHFFALFASFGLPGAFFCIISISFGSFLCVFARSQFFLRFFSFLEAPGPPPESKKPLKSLYCRQISRFR